MTRLREMKSGFRTEYHFLKPSSAIRNVSAVKMIVKVGIVLRGVCVLLLLVRLGSAHAADSVKSRNDSFCQGSNLLESLARRRSIAVESISLRELLNDIQAEFGICLILDRRIDPSTRMVVTTPLVRTDQLLQSISDELPDCGVSVGRELVYFGPRLENL